MLGTLVCAVALAGPTAADFFPLQPGRRAIYEEKGISNALTVDIVGSEVEIGLGSAREVVTQDARRRPISHAYYMLTSDTVYLVAYSKEDPLPAPMPLFKVGEKKQTWEYNGRTGSRPEAELFVASGESELKGSRDVLGKMTEVLEVKITASVGTGPAQETVEQRATYAKGVGLVELVSKTTVLKRTVESTLKLIKVENPGGSGTTSSNGLRQ